MIRNVYRRTPLIVIGVLAFFALSNANAFASGKPTVKETHSNEEFVMFPRFNVRSIEAAINPNGEATTYKVEFGPTPSFGYSTPEFSVGAGTVFAYVDREVRGLLPGATNYIRVAAKNKSGTTYGETITESLEGWEFTGTRPAPYVANGAFTVKFDHPIAGAEMKFSCNSTAGGKLGSSGGTSDEYNIAPSGCGLYANGEKCSSATVNTIHLNGRLVDSEGWIAFTVPEGSCFFEGQVNFPIKEPFAFDYSLYSWSLQVEHLLKLVNQTQWGAYTATITDESTWKLSGADKGVAFAMGW